MREEIIYELSSLYRDNMRIRAIRFGEGEDSACVVGSARGNEIQQLYISAHLIGALREEEAMGNLAPEKSVLVIPTINNYSLNMGKRFWPTDNTDINRMFPGYNQGETTQRIAAAVFERISRFKYGIQLAGYYMSGLFTPHVSIMKTGYENPELARLFDIPYVVLRQPKPYDTATLNYNWQIWNTQAFSLYSQTSDQVDEDSADAAVRAILNFLRQTGVLLGKASEKNASKVLDYNALITVRTTKAGLFRRLAQINQDVKKGDALACILDPFTGEELERIIAPADARIFFTHDKPLTYACSVLFKIIPQALV